MSERRPKRRLRRKRTTRWLVAAVVLCSAMSCIAPVLYASDCSRWVAEYKQGILQRRAARRLAAAKFRLTALIRPTAPLHHPSHRRPMGPLEALHRFQIDCGDFATPELAPKLASLPVIAPPLAVEFPAIAPPDLPTPAFTQVAEAVPPLQNVPVTSTPLDSVPVVGAVPEPTSLLLVASGLAVGAAAVRRRRLAS